MENRGQAKPAAQYPCSGFQHGPIHKVVTQSLFISGKAARRFSMCHLGPFIPYICIVLCEAVLGFIGFGSAPSWGAGQPRK